MQNNENPYLFIGIDPALIEDMLPTWASNSDFVHTARMAVDLVQCAASEITSYIEQSTGLAVDVQVMVPNILNDVLSNEFVCASYLGVGYGCEVYLICREAERQVVADALAQAFAMPPVEQATDEDVDTMASMVAEPIIDTAMAEIAAMIRETYDAAA